MLHPRQLRLSFSPAFLAVSLVAANALLGGCAPVVETPQETDEHDNEVMTTVELSFTPQSGSEALVFLWADPKNDGQSEIDDVVLSLNETYRLSLRFLNELADPIEDVTIEIRDEEKDHQVFIYGDGVDGPATLDNADALVVHSYEDTDGNGLPVGLENSVATVEAGSGTLNVLLRHMPLLETGPLKVEDLEDDFATGGDNALPGSTDIDVSFPLIVEE